MIEWRQLKIARDFTYFCIMRMASVPCSWSWDFGGIWHSSLATLALIAFTIGKYSYYDVSELDRGFRIVSFIVLGVTAFGNIVSIPTGLARSFPVQICEESRIGS